MGASQWNSVRSRADGAGIPQNDATCPRIGIEYSLTEFLMNPDCRLVRWCVFTLAWAAAAGATVKLPTVIGDHMAIQRDQAVPIWGSAEPGERVTVGIDAQQKTTTA